MRPYARRMFLVLAALCGGASGASAQDYDELARQISNPVADLVSVPFQYNYDEGFFDGLATRSVLNIQPVVPFRLNDRWNLITRTIIPVVSQEGFQPSGGTQSGVGNIIQSFFFSPNQPGANGLIWGAGPVLQFPSTTSEVGRKQVGAGLTGVMLRQTGPWTVGMLGNHIWSVNKADTLGETSVTFLQPFVTYRTPKFTTFGMNTEAAYDWKSEQWAVPINLSISQIVPIGGRPVSIGAGVRYWAESPRGGPEGWGARLTVTLLFPRG